MSEPTAADMAQASRLLDLLHHDFLNIADVETAIGEAIATARTQGAMQERAKQFKMQDEHNALKDERDRLKVRVETLETAWKQSWDCSHDPGHSIMRDAVGHDA
jgi:hypothetical protein